MQSNNGSSVLAKFIIFLVILCVIAYIIIFVIALIINVIIFIAAIAFIIYVFSMLFSGPITLGSVGILTTILL